MPHKHVRILHSNRHSTPCVSHDMIGFVWQCYTQLSSPSHPVRVCPGMKASSDTMLLPLNASFLGVASEGTLPNAVTEGGWLAVDPRRPDYHDDLKPAPTCPRFIICSGRSYSSPKWRRAAADGHQRCRRLRYRPHTASAHATAPNPRRCNKPLAKPSASLRTNANALHCVIRRKSQLGFATGLL